MTAEVYITDHGAVGDYNTSTGTGTDNAPAIIASIAALGSRGGHVVVPDGFIGRVAQNITLPDGCSIVCKSPLVGHVNPSSLPSLGSALYLDGVSITMKSGTALRVNLFRKGLQFNITSTQVANSFTGTAVILADNSADHILQDMMILGFAQAVSSQTTTGTTAFTSRTKFLGVVAVDCIAGVHIHNAADIPVLSGLECWPYVTVASSAEPNGAHLKRSGTAIWLSGVNDWAKLDLPFNLGYKIGYRFTDCNAIKAFGAGADYPASANDGSVGFMIDGAASEITLIGCQVAQHDSGVYVASTATQHAVTLIGCDLWENRINGVAVAQGSVQMIGGRIRSSVSSSNGVQTGPSAGKVRVLSVDFLNLSGTAIVNDNPSVDLQHQLCTFRNVAAVALNSFIPQVAAIDPLPLPTESDTVILTAGVANIGTVANSEAHAGKLVSFHINTSLTLIHGNSFVMPSNQVCSPGDVLLFMSRGGKLYLVSHSSTA